MASARVGSGPGTRDRGINHLASGGAAEALRGPLAGPRSLELAVARRCSRHQLGEQVARDVATSSTARANAASLAFDGFCVPLTLRTYWSAPARTSSSVAGGSKLWRVLMFRHMSPA